VNISHQLRGKRVEKEVKNARFGTFISNKIGGLLFFDSSVNLTQYYARVGNRTIKFIDSLSADGEVKTIRNRFYSLDILRDQYEQEIFVPQFTNSLMIKSNKEFPLRISISPKDIHTKDEFSRHSVYDKQGRIIIASTGRTGVIYTAIQGTDLKYSYTGKSALSFELLSPKIAIAFSDTEAQAISSANHLFLNEQKIKEIQEKCISATTDFKDAEHTIAYASVLNSLDSVFFQDPAGDVRKIRPIPAFLNVTSTYTSIAMHSLLMEGEFRLVKTALLSEIDYQYGLTKTRTPEFGELAWPIVLLGRFLNILCKQKKLYDYLTVDEIKDTVDKVTALAQILAQICRDQTDQHETVESNSILLSIYDLLYALTKSDDYTEQIQTTKQETQQAIRKIISKADKKGVLKEDVKAAFLAAYIYPSLLGTEEWVDCFDVLLRDVNNSFQTLQSKIIKDEKTNTLDLDIFGLSTLAAIVLHRIEPEHYKINSTTLVKNAIITVLYTGILSRPTSSFDQMAEPENGPIIENKHLLNSSLFLEMLRECA